MAFDREQLAWAGGFFSGEGSTHILTNRTGRCRKYCRLTITNTSRQALIRFHRSVGFLGTLPKNSYPMREHKPVYMWRAADFEQSQALIALLWKFLSREKQLQAKKVVLACRLNAFRCKKTEVKENKVKFLGKWSHGYSAYNKGCRCKICRKVQLKRYLKHKK